MNLPAPRVRVRVALDECPRTCAMAYDASY